MSATQLSQDFVTLNKKHFIEDPGVLPLALAEEYATGEYKTAEIALDGSTFDSATSGRADLFCGQRQSSFWCTRLVGTRCSRRRRGGSSRTTASSTFDRRRRGSARLTRCTRSTCVRWSSSSYERWLTLFTPQTFKYLEQKPVGAFHRSAQFLQILSAEAEGLVKCTVVLPDAASDKLISDLGAMYKSDYSSAIAEAWNGTREDIIRMAVKEHLAPAAEVWARNLLQEEEEEFVGKQCAAKLDQVRSLSFPPLVELQALTTRRSAR